MIGNQIKKFRTEQGMTQQNLADQLFVTAQAVSRWENGEVEPSLSTITKMAQIFHVTTDEMLGVDAKEPKASAETEQAAEVFAETELKEEKEEKSVSEQPQKTSLGNCEKCKRPIYKNEELVIKHVSYGRNSSTQHVYCIQCEEKAKAERAQHTAIAAASRRKKSYILGGLGAAVVLAILIAVGVFKTPSLIAVGILAPICTYTLISCLLLENNFIGDMIAGIASRSVQMPGVIFSLNLDGIIWLLTVKLGLFLLSVLISVALFLLAIGLGLVVSAFVYPFALSKSIRHPEKDDFAV